MKFLLFLLLISTAYAAEWQGECLDVTDGDTIVVMYQGLPVRVRLHGIDAPERGQDFGRRARSHLESLIEGKTLTLQKMDIDRYYRVIARVWIGEVDVNREMIAAGYAWVYPQYCTQEFCENWRAAEAEARESGWGMWAAKPIPPWEWRREKRR